MNDEIIEHINTIRYKLNDTISEYKEILTEVSSEEQKKLQFHISQLEIQMKELYEWFI